MTRAASGPELRWRSCAALPRRTSPTFETLWSSTRVMRMLSRSPNPSLCVYTFTYALVHRPCYTEHGTRRGAGGQEPDLRTGISFLDDVRRLPRDAEC